MPDPAKKLTLTQRWFLFNIWYARVFGVIFAVLALLITASLVPGLMRGDDISGGYLVLLIGPAFALIGVGLYLGATKILRWYRRQLSLDEAGPLLQTKRDADAYIDKTLGAWIDRPRTAKILTGVSIAVPLTFVLWQALAPRGWFEVAFHPLAWILSVVWLVCTAAVVRRKRRWWLLLGAPAVFYPLYQAARLFAVCSTGDCL
jgi:hypothetical protein